MRKFLLKILTLFIFGVFGGIFADQILWPYFIERPLFLKYRLETNPIYLIEKKEITIQENAALKNAVEKVEGAVIGVKTKTKEGQVLEGSGFVLTSDGLAISFSNLVPQGSDYSFFLDGKLVSCQILKRDLKENLVLIKIDKKNLPTSGFFNLDDLKLGERVFLLGMVFEKEGIKKIVNEGIVRNFDQNSIETNIFEKPNLAGSPLFDIEGNILGLTTINKEGRVIAVPISKIKTFTGL